MSKTDRSEAVSADHLCEVMPSIKLSFDNQIRRTKTVQNLPTYDFLKLAAKKLFPALHQIADVDFLWSDDEGDTIVVSSDKELIEAIRIMNIEQRPSYRFEVRKGSPTTSFTFLRDEVDSAIPKPQKVLDVIHPDIKCSECDRKGIGGSSIVGIRYKCLVRHLDLCEVCEMTEMQPFPMIKYYFPEKVATTFLERRRRIGRGSLKGPHYRIHSRGLILNSLEQPHPKSLIWLSYLRSLSSGPTSSTTKSINQRESKNPRKFSRLPFCLKLTPMEPAIVPFNTEQAATANSESIKSFKVVEKVIPADVLPIPVASISQFNFTVIPTPATPSPKPLFCLVRDLNIPDSTRALCGSIFLKTWRIRNIGSLKWQPNVVLLYTGGDSLSVSEEDLVLAVTRLAPGQGMFFFCLTLS